MSNPTPQTLPERFSAMILALCGVVTTRGLCGLLAGPVQAFIFRRIQALSQKFHRLVARIEAGTYKPRRPGTRRPTENPKPRQPAPVRQQFGWVKAAMDGQANAHRGWLQILLEDPEMVALIRQAPAEFSRILRPLCWMLHLDPPAILAPPPRKPRPEPRPKPRRKIAAPAAAPAQPAPPPPYEPYPDAYPRHRLGPAYLRRA